MVEENVDSQLPTYTAFLTFVTFLDWIGEMTITPSRIDRSLWGSKFAGGTGPQLMGGLRFLGLLKGDVPQDALEDLARADPGARKKLLADVLCSTYGSDL